MDRDQLNVIAAKRGRPSIRRSAAMSVDTVRAAASARSTRRSASGAAVASRRSVDADQVRQIAKLLRGGR